MRTYILQLDQHDDIVSTRDKMRWGKAGRILLVWPERGQILNRRLDLVMLQRHSIYLGVKLALVTRDPEIRYHAPRLGIPVFKSLRRAQSAVWRVPRRFRKAQEQAEGGFSPLGQRGLSGVRDAGGGLPERPPRARELHPVIRLIAFTLGVLAFLSIAAVLLPGAEVTLVPEQREQEHKVNVQASPDFSRVELSGSIPATWSTVTVEGRQSLPVSGSIKIPAQQATGQATFTNLTDLSVTVPEGTIVRTLDPEAIRFEVTRGDQIPAIPGESVTLPIRCLVPGPEGNLPANSLVAIEGLLGTQLSVTNSLPTRRGSERVEPAPSQQDREQLSNELEDALKKTALRELEDGLATGDLIVPESLQLVEVLEESYLPAGDQPADHLELNLRLEFRALVVSRIDLDELAHVVLEANLPEGFIPIDDSVTFTRLTRPTLEEGESIRWQMLVQQDIRAHLKEPQTIQLVLGQTPAQAQARLTKSLPLQASPNIVVSPSWWPRLPILPFRVSILYQESDPTAYSSTVISP